jgi:hypothetical protein
MSNNWNCTDVLSRDVEDNCSPTAYAEFPPSVNYGSTAYLSGTGSTDNIGIINYSWSFVHGGQPVVLYGMAQEFIFNELGNNSITLTVTDAFGNWDAHTFVLLVRDMENPQADAGIDLFLKERGTADFDGTSSTDNVGIMNYTWTFTYNGTIVTLYGPEPSFLFWVPGVYDVTLRTTDIAGQTSEDSTSVTVLNDPDIIEFPWWIPMFIIMAVIAGIVGFIVLRKDRE